jgi:carboxyl-terminal processing protease
LPQFEQELARFDANIKKLKSGNQTPENLKVLSPAEVKLISPARAEFYQLQEGASVYSDRPFKIKALAPELSQLKALRMSNRQQLNENIRLRFNSREAVDLWVAYFKPFRQGDYMPAPRLETDASANQYGQADIKIANAMEIENLPAVNVHQYRFDGIGISFNMMNDTLFIVEVITGGPSEKVGLLAGDRILSVDDEVIAGVKMSNKEVMKRLKGPKGTLVRIGVKRRGEPELLEFRIIRDKIPLYSLDAAFMADKKTGYIRLSRFSATTMKEFKEAFEELRQQGMEQLILDLQSNGGGYMNTAVELADEFLPKGRSVVYTEGLNSPRYQADASERGSFEKGNLIVLIDEYSASSSEIVAGAVQDWDRGLIIGRRSFGKGLVQRIFPLGDGTALKLTVSRYYTPSGRCIQKPYREGVEAYGRDLIERYNRGEMSSADSIHFPDSLRYSTMIEKRTVYGGGGIMPDVFVPVDTSRYTDLHRELVNKGILNRFILTYVDENRRALLDKYGENSQEFIQEFQFDDELLEELFKLAIKENVKITDEHRQEDLSVLRLQCKAYMARDLCSENRRWNRRDFFPEYASGILRWSRYNRDSW